VAGTEPRDGHVVGGLVGRQDAKSDVLVAAAFELAGGAHADAVAVQQHAQQGLWVVGGMPMAVITVDTVEGLQVELVDHVEDEQGEVAGGEPVAQVGWEQEGLVAVATQEVVGHGLFYLVAVLAPNALILNRLSRKACLLWVVTQFVTLSGCDGRERPSAALGDAAMVNSLRRPRPQR
jgi:hypothetical protein